MTASTSAHLPISDPSALSSMAEYLDDGSLNELVVVCLADAREKSERIVAASTSEDWPQAAQFAHDIKSTAGQMGAKRLADIARHLEAVCNSADTRTALDMVQDLARATEATLEAYAPHLLPEILASARQEVDD